MMPEEEADPKADKKKKDGEEDEKTKKKVYINFLFFNIVKIFNYFQIFHCF